MKNPVITPQNLTERKSTFRWTFIFFLILVSGKSFAQSKNVPYLEREITIVAQNKTIEDVLSEMSQQAGFIFSYSPEALHSNNKVTLNIQKRPVRVALNEIFDDQINYKAKGKYIILKKPLPAKEKQEETIQLEGYVYDSRTGNRLNNASIYDKGLMVSAVTNEYGYFLVNVPANKPITALKVSKLGYSDTAFMATSERRLKTIEVSVNTKDSAQVKKWQSFINLDKITPKWLIPKKTKINALNIGDSVFRAVQVSLFPYVTTNHFVGGNVVNDFSLNMTVGYIQGVRILEIGGIMNIVRDNASYVQLGGVGNIVGGRVTGVQCGGIFSYASEVKGVQASGTVNLAGDANVQLSGIINRANTNTLQVSGYVNWAGNSNVQITGIINKASDNFLQIGGIINWSKKSNMQIAGIFNKSKQVDNMQIAGILNQATEVNALQVAGIVNNVFENSVLQVAGCVNSTLGTTDVQIAPLVNVAGKVNKLQVGLVNIADSCDGMPIGLLSFVKNGYHKLEFSVNEMFPFNTAFRTGVKQFHTSLTVGINPFRYTSPVWTFGYGLGTSFGKKDKLLFDTDISFNHVVYGGNYTDGSNLYTAYVGIDRKITRKMTLAFGLTYNLMTSDINTAYYGEVYSRLQPYSLTNSTKNNGTNVRTWIGARLAVRFF
ncbi:MAG TPA: carboxypeptidase-like regulatory domain-containing protein [Bacteroidales bacterium]|nr:carboxypeptidase-like regulatory domain-containing protein [Bacteroidales bacterium]